VPNDVTWIFDFKTSQKMGKDFPVMKLVANTNLAHSDFKSVVINGEQLYVIMTSKRPNLTHLGTIATKQSKKEIDNCRMVIQNSQIYHLDLTFLQLSTFFNPKSARNTRPG
jgi:hypothetical protein